MATKLIDLGMKRKEIHGGPTTPSPKSEKDYENEKIYPELDVSGAHAEMLGAEDLKEGDVIEQTVRWRVKRHSATTENGKTDYRMTLCMEKASDCVECEKEKGDDDEDGDSREKRPSAALEYLAGGE